MEESSLVLHFAIRTFLLPLHYPIRIPFKEVVFIVQNYGHTWGLKLLANGEQFLEFHVRMGYGLSEY